MQTYRFIVVGFCFVVGSCGQTEQKRDTQPIGTLQIPQVPTCNPKQAEGCSKESLSNLSGDPSGQNAPCDTEADCSEGFGCGRLISWNPSFEMDGDTRGRSPGLCLAYCAPVPEWDSFEAADCTDGLICAHIIQDDTWQEYQGVCTDIAIRQENEGCETHVDCHGMLACMDGFCSRYPEDWECFIDDDCQEGLVCWNTDHPCEDSPEETCSHQICRAPGNGGQDDPCRDNLDCGDGFWCYDGICNDPHSHCTNDRDCGEGLQCIDGVCV
ncbi:hypothetical protein ACFL6C_09790 [Myxococcota bacterium]